MKPWKHMANQLLLTLTIAAATGAAMSASSEASEGRDKPAAPADSEELGLTSPRANSCKAEEEGFPQ